MTKSTTAQTIPRLLLAGAVSASLCAFLPFTSVAEAGSPFSRPARYEIFEPGEGRDPLQHLLFLAEHGKTASERGKGYRHLAEILDRVGRHREAMRAYDAAAQQGDRSSARLIVDAFVAGRYRPQNLPALVDLAVLPEAMAGGVTAELLMADLVASGKLRGEQYHSSGYWLQLAADQGSKTALRRLAVAAERSGNVKAASGYYAALDGKRMSKLDRALRQAKVYYLGEEVKRSRSLALAWLDFAARRDPEAAGKLAARLYRNSTNPEDRGALLLLAQAGGILDPDTGGGLDARLVAAKTPEARTALMGEIKRLADDGNGEAATVYWRALVADGAAPALSRQYLSLAVASGNSQAISEARGVLARLDIDDSETGPLLAVLEVLASAGNLEALKALGSLYASGGPVLADAAASLEYFRKAADGGDRDAQLRVGLHFAQEEEDSTSLELARRYLGAAAAQGSASAKAYLDALPIG